MAVPRQNIPYKITVNTVGIVFLQQLYRILRPFLTKEDPRHISAKGAVVNTRILILGQKFSGSFQQLHGPVQQLLFAAFRAEALVYGSRLISYFKGVWVLLESLFRFAQTFPVLLDPEVLQSFHCGFQAVILQFIPQQHIHRSIEENGQFHKHGQLRQGKPCFPLIYRAHRDPQHLGQLLLGQSPLLAESTDILCQLDSHMTAPFSFTAFIITNDSPNENTPLIPSGQLFVILTVLFFKYRRPHILCSDDLQPQVEGLCLILEQR